MQRNPGVRDAHAAQQINAVTFGEVHADALGDQQGRRIVGNVVEPGRIGSRGRHQVVVLSRRVQPFAQRNDVRKVDVVLLDLGSRVDPEHSIVKPTSHMQHRGPVGRREKLSCPDVELSGADGDRHHLTAALAKNGLLLQS